MSEFIPPPEIMDTTIAAYREALIRNAPQPELTRIATRLDPEVVAWLELMRGEQCATAPDPTFVKRLAAQLETTPGPTTVLRPAPPEALRVRRSHAVSLLPRGEFVVAPVPSHTTRWMKLRRVFAHLTTVVLLLILAVGFMSLRQRISQAPDEGQWAPALVRALDAAPGVVDIPLVEARFAPTELPSGQKEALYYQLILPPDASLPYLGAPFCGCRRDTIASGVGVEVVQSGIYTLRLGAPLRVQRAGTPDHSEEIPAGIAVTLTAGDVAIYADYAAPGDVRNAGKEPVTLIGVAIIAAEGSGVPVPMAPPGVQATLWEHVLPADWTVLPPGPLNLTLRQVTLPPGTSIGAYQPVGLQAMRIESGMISRNLIRVGETAPSGPPLVQATGSTISSVLPGLGLRETLANTGVTPAALKVLIIEPVVSGAQSLGG